jgi:hypothetical protein
MRYEGPMTDDVEMAAVIAAESSGDQARIDAARAAYLDVHPSGKNAAAVHYRAGLTRLFVHQDTEGAGVHFKAAASEKGASVASEARVSLALVLMSKGKRQQAIFELRKLLPQGAAPSIHTAQALDFLSLLLRESQAASSEILAIDEQRKQHLTALAQDTQSVPEKAHYLLRLAAAYIDGGTGTDLKLAKTQLDVVDKLGAAAGEAALTGSKHLRKSLTR